MSVLPSLSTSMPKAAARLRKSSMLLYGFVPLSRAASISVLTALANIRFISVFPALWVAVFAGFTSFGSALS